jgi:hypothetical protein
MYDPYMRRYQFDVPSDGSIHPFSFVCSEDGRDAVTGVSGLVVDDPRDVSHIHPEAPASNLSLNVFGYASSGYVYARGNTPGGSTRHIEWDVACAKVVSPTEVKGVGQ